MNNNLFQITGIGSLPHPHFDSALKHILKYDIPFLPQLPNRDPKETMIYQSLDGIGDLELEVGGTVTIKSLYQRDKQALMPNQQSYHSLLPFSYEVSDKNLSTIKLQFTGAYTLFKYSKYKGKDDNFFKILGDFLIAKIRNTLELFADATIYLQIDEPALFSLSNHEDHKPVEHFYKNLMSLKTKRIKIGFHCCSNIHWGFLLKFPIDFLSFDVELSMQSILLHSKQLLKIPNLFLGVIPTNLAATIETYDSSIEANKLFSLLQKKYCKQQLKTFLEKIYLTPACGLGQKRVAITEEYVIKLREYQKTLSNIYFS